VKLSEENDIFLRKQKSKDRKNDMKLKAKGNNLYEQRKKRTAQNKK
jgi:hypothetical protein